MNCSLVFLLVMIQNITSCSNSTELMGTWIGIYSQSDGDTLRKYALNEHIVTFTDSEFEHFCKGCIPQNFTGIYKQKGMTITYDDDANNQK